MIEQRFTRRLSGLSVSIITNGEERIKKMADGNSLFCVHRLLRGHSPCQDIEAGSCLLTGSLLPVCEDYFAKRIAEETHGTIKVKVYPYISLTEHTNTVRLFLTSKRFFDSYPPEIQAKIMKVGKESTDVNRKRR